MRAERTYFDVPQLDRAMAVVWQLAEELNVVSQRCRVLELLLVRSDILKAGEVDRVALRDHEQAELDQCTEDLVARLLKVVTEDGPAAHPLRDEAPRTGSEGRQ